MIVTKDNLDLKYFYMWALLILYTLLFKKHYILKCVPVLTFGKKETVPVVQFKTKNQHGELTKMKTETLIKAIQVVCVCEHMCPFQPVNLTLSHTLTHTWPLCVSILSTKYFP